MDEMAQAHREDQATQDAATLLAREIQAFLRASHPRVTTRLQQALQDVHADLTSLSDHIVAVWD